MNWENKEEIEIKMAQVLAKLYAEQYGYENPEITVTKMMNDKTALAN